MSVAVFIKRIIIWKKNASAKSTMELAVQGVVALKQNGEATISLSPLVQMNAATPPRAAAPTPNPEMVATWEIHPARRPITRDTMTQDGDRSKATASSYRPSNRRMVR